MEEKSSIKLTNFNDDNQLNLLLKISNTDDLELFEIVIERLRYFNTDRISNYDELCKRVNQLMAKYDDVTQKKFNNFLDKKIKK